MPHSDLGLTSASYADNDLLTAQQALWLEDLKQQVWDASDILSYIGNTNQEGERMTIPELSNSGALDLRDGGSSIDIPLDTAANSTVMSYEGFQTLNIQPQNTLRPAFVDWREYAVAVSISNRDEKLNMRSEGQIVRLLSQKQRNAMMSLKDRINSDLWKGDQEQASLAKTNTTDLDGVTYYVSEDGNGSNAVANIDPSANSYWVNKHNAGDQTVSDTSPQFSSIGNSSLLTLLQEASAGQNVDEPDIFFTNLTVYSQFWDELDDLKRFTGNSADPMFRTMSFNGIPVKYSKSLDALGRNNIYGLNSNYIHLVAHEDVFFDSDGFRSPTNQTARTSLILFLGNLIFSSRRRQLVMSDID